jgi:DNA-directed RNA polymerase specialized sigma24 family protein
MATNWVDEAHPRLSGLESVTEEQWIETWKKLRLFTWSRYGSLPWLDLDDVVHQAIVDTLEGRRRWPKQEMSLLHFLCGVVRSIISHRWVRERKKVSIENLKSGGFSDYEGSDTASLEGIIHGSIGEYLRCEATYNRGFYNLLVDAMCELLGEDPLLISIVRLWSKDPRAKPSDIAQELGLKMSDMRAAQKRLRRKLQVVREK